MGIVVHRPPVGIEAQHLRARAQPHVERAHRRQQHVEAERVGADARVGDDGELGVELRGQDLVVGVVLVDRVGGLLPLFGRVEGARWQFVDVDLLAGLRPIDVLDRHVIHDPRSGPTVESVGNELSRTVGVVGRQRLQFVKDHPIPHRPREQWAERHDREDSRGLNDAAPVRPLPEPPGKVEPDRAEQEAAVRAQLDGGRDRGAAPDPRPQRTALLQLFQTAPREVEGQSGAEDLWDLGERVRHVVGGERAERGQEEGRLAGLFGDRAPGDGRDHERGAHVQGELHEHHSAVVLDADHRPDRRQQRGVTRQADVGRLDRSGSVAEPEDAVLQPVLGQLAVDERVSIHTRETKDEEEAQRHRPRGRQQEVALVPPEQLSHATNIAHPLRRPRLPRFDACFLQALA